MGNAIFLFSFARVTEVRHIYNAFSFDDGYFYSNYFSAGLLATSTVTALEENGGSDGNSSVAELEVRVEALEGTAVDHETRFSTVDSDVSGR